MLYQGGEREKYTHFEIDGHVQMAKSDPEAQRKSSLLDCTWLENEYGSFNLEALEFLMHFREPGSSLYFYTYSYIFFLFSYIYIYIYFFLFLINFLFAPLVL
jgi:cellulose synthase/poly-beta-1,6-N-acetylglucosamine synthase-like glycosyltransferase